MESVIGYRWVRVGGAFCSPLWNLCGRFVQAVFPLQGRGFDGSVVQCGMCSDRMPTGHVSLRVLVSFPSRYHFMYAPSLNITVLEVCDRPCQPAHCHSSVWTSSFSPRLPGFRIRTFNLFSANTVSVSALKSFCWHTCNGCSVKIM